MKNLVTGLKVVLVLLALVGVFAGTASAMQAEPDCPASCDGGPTDCARLTNGTVCLKTKPPIIIIIEYETSN